MNLTSLRTTIMESTPADWHQVTYGPFFHSVPYYGDDSYHSEHSSRAVLMDDVNVSIEWGLPTHENQDEQGHLWIKNAPLPDPAVHSFWIDVFYNGGIVDRIRAFSVDGGRGYLPRYDQHRIDGGEADDYENATWEFTVTPWDYAVTALVGGLDGLREFDYYFKAAGFTRP